MDFLSFDVKWIEQISAGPCVMGGKEAALISAVNTFKRVQRETATLSKRQRR